MAFGRAKKKKGRRRRRKLHDGARGQNPRLERSFIARQVPGLVPCNLVDLCQGPPCPSHLGVASASIFLAAVPLVSDGVIARTLHHGRQEGRALGNSYSQ